MKLVAVLESIIIVVGFTIGVSVGRWWSVLAVVPFGAWIWAEWHVEGPPSWFLAIAYGSIATLSIAVGVGASRLLRRA